MGPMELPFIRAFLQDQVPHRPITQACPRQLNRRREHRHRPRSVAMKTNLRGTIVRLAVFLTVCALGAFAVLMVFGQLRFGPEKSYRAEFSDASGLKGGDFVRIAGVEVGKVKRLSILDNGIVVVDFATDDTVVLTESTKALIRYDNLYGGRYLELQEGAGAVKKLAVGQTIPLQRTVPALDLDALIGGFRPLFRALNPDQVNALTGQLIQAFQGEGETIGAFLAQTASVTSTLADRDQLIGQVVTNLNAVLGSLGQQSDHFDKAVDSLSVLVKGLAEHKSEIASALAYTNTAAASLADLLAKARQPLKSAVVQSDRATSIMVADHDYLDNLLNTLPDAYQALSRQAIYGDFFSFYICDVVIKLNGKGGQPVYTKLVGQPTGRCAPK
jgi:phospholipid/cholesterol/gamma-HCH transport system substrate-binding protein